jgi:importin-4
VSALCDGLAETINKLGPAFLVGRKCICFICIECPQRFMFLDLEPISSIAVQVLEQKSLCQQDPDQDQDAEVFEDQAEYDAVLIMSAGELVSALANALGADFSQAFNNLFPIISKYYVSCKNIAILHFFDVSSLRKSAVRSLSANMLLEPSQKSSPV